MRRVTLARPGCAERGGGRRLGRVGPVLASLGWSLFCVPPVHLRQVVQHQRQLWGLGGFASVCLRRSTRLLWAVVHVAEHTLRTRHRWWVPFLLPNERPRRNLSCSHPGWHQANLRGPGELLLGMQQCVLFGTAKEGSCFPGAIPVTQSPSH